jgi:hypothetical protein
MSVATDFVRALNRRDVSAAIAMCQPAGEVLLPHLDGPGTLGGEGRAYFDQLVTAFPDLRIRTKGHFEMNDGVEVAELNVSGTQAGDFIGIVNQEKFCDLDQAWRFTTADGVITGLRCFWDQTMLLRRLGVKRLDNITITEGVAS